MKKQMQRRRGVIASLVAAVLLSLASPVAVPAVAAPSGDLPFPIPEIPGMPKKEKAPTFPVDSVFPKDGATMGVAQPIIINFSTPPNREQVYKWVKVEGFTKDGDAFAIKGKFRWWSGTQLRWRPEKFWPAHTQVKVSIGTNVRNLNVGARKVAIADDKTHQISVYIDNKLVKTVPTSMGKPGHETPNGIYYIGDKHRKMVMDSSTYGVPVTAPEGYKVDVEYALRMSYSGIFLHGAPWSVWAQGNSNTSHGCLNVSTANAQWFFKNWNRGDVVWVRNTKGGNFSKTDGMGDWAPGT